MKNEIGLFFAKIIGFQKSAHFHKCNWKISIKLASLQPSHSPPILLQLHTRITVHAQTADRQQSNGNFEARMSQKCREWRDQFIMTLSPIHWVPVQDKGSKIPCVKFGAMKIIQSDRLHQEYLTMDLGILVTKDSCSYCQ